MTYYLAVIVTILVTIVVEPGGGMADSKGEGFLRVWRDFSQTAPLILGLATWPLGPFMIPPCFALRWLVARIAGIAPSPSVTMSA